VTETQLKEKVKDYLKAKGIFGFKIAGGPRQRAGISDFLIVIPPTGQLLAMELKAPGKLNELTDLQKNFLEKVSNAGGFACAVDNLESAKSIIDLAVTRARVA
jgi:hypothetical protein